jgi:cytochrome P450
VKEGTLKNRFFKGFSLFWFIYRALELSGMLPLHPLSKFGLSKFTTWYREQTINLQVINDFVDKIVADRRQTRNQEWKLIYKFLDVEIDGKLLADKNVRFDLNAAIFGTYDTLNPGISFALYCLAKYPKEQQKVYQEMNEILGNEINQEISERHLNKMTYTHAFLKETLRLYPPVPYLSRKISSEITTGGYTFPKDAEIIISPYLMGRNPKYFKDPLTFDVKRFIGSDSDPPGFIPFSLAPRKCIGIKFAYNTMKIFVVKVLSKFEVSLPENQYKLKLSINPTLTSEKDMIVNVCRRVDNKKC